MKTDNIDINYSCVATAINFFVELVNEVIRRINSLVFAIFSEKEAIIADLRDYHIIDLKDDAPIDHPQVQLSPSSSIIFNVTTEQFIYIAPAPPIKNVVISGGGAKGVGLPGVFKAFEEHTIGELSFRDQLEHFIGSSIGAVSALLGASGSSSDELISAMSKENFKALLGKGRGPFFKDGKPLLDFIRRNIQQSISKRLTEMGHVEKLEDIDVKQMVIDQLKMRGKELAPRKRDKFVKEIESIIPILKNQDLDKVCITFAMLHALRRLNPRVFKDLTVTATCRENGKTYYFDHLKTPTFDAAVACRASASLPLFLNPVTVEPAQLLPGYVHEKPMTFVDGGYLDNIPVDSAIHKQGKKNRRNQGEQGQNLQTLVIVFDEARRKEREPSRFHEVAVPQPLWYHPSHLLQILIRDIFAKYAAGINTDARNTVKKHEGLEKIRTAYTQRSIPLLIDIKTTDFDAAQKNAAKYIDLGYTQGLEYLMNHAHELIYRTFDTLDDLLKYMPKNERLRNEDQIEAFRLQCQ